LFTFRLGWGQDRGLAFSTASSDGSFSFLTQTYAPAYAHPGLKRSPDAYLALKNCVAGALLALILLVG